MALENTSEIERLINIEVEELDLKMKFADGLGTTKE